MMFYTTFCQLIECPAIPATRSHSKHFKLMSLGELMKKMEKLKRSYSSIFIDYERESSIIYTYASCYT